jgi:serine/threonine protein kinase
VNTFGILQLTMAALSLFAATIQGAQAVLIPRERTHRIIALGCFGFALFNTGLIFVSRASGASAPAPLWGWIAAGVALPMLMWAVPKTAWAMLELPPSPGFSLLTALLASVGVLRLGGLLLMRYRHPELLWESVNTGFTTLAVPAGVAAIVAPSVWVVGGLRARRRETPFARASVAFGFMGVAASIEGLLVTLGLIDGPELYGFGAVPFVAFANVLSTLRYVNALKTRDQPAGDIARYQILRPLGEGGMGEVFLARRAGPGGFSRDVVLKTLHAGSTDPAAKERFLAEARVAAQLKHPNIIDVYDLGEQPGGFFIVMEHLDGVTLGDMLRACQDVGRPVPADDVAEIGVHLCRALGFAHSAGVLHRDLKPQNVMLTFTGAVKLIDFGIAQQKPLPSDVRLTIPPSAPERAEKPTRLTQAFGVVGTDGYIAPERLSGADASPESDLFSLGVVLYFLLAGRHPFPAACSLDFLAAVDGRTAPPLSLIRQDAPTALVAAIESCLAFGPTARPPSAASLEAHLAHALHGRRVDLAACIAGMFPQRPSLRPAGERTTPAQPEVSSALTVSARAPGGEPAAQAGPTRPAR